MDKTENITSLLGGHPLLDILGGKTNNLSMFCEKDQVL